MMAKIKNLDKIATTPERRIALQIIESGLQSIDTKFAIKNSMRIFDNSAYIGNEKYDLSNIENIFVVGVGKCAVLAVSAINDVLGSRITRGIALDIREGAINNKNIQTFVGDHPYPSQRNIEATRSIIELLKSAEEKDLVVTVISGGGSALLCQPKKGMTSAMEKELTEAFFHAGAPIQEVNIVRKHISYAKGGFLAEYAYPAKIASLIFSDVPGNDIRFISSGPTVFDDTTIESAKKVIDKYGLSSKLPFLNNALIETPKEPLIFDKVKNDVIVSNTIALNEMKKSAEAKGLQAKIITEDYCGFAEEVGKRVVSDLDKYPKNTVLLYGGESTVLVKGHGKGGRNQEVSLSALEAISKKDLVISIASDGKDNSDFAGGICDTITKQKAKQMSLNPSEFLKKNDSYRFFEKTGDFISTGDTGSNVSDIIIAVRFK